MPTTPDINTDEVSYLAYWNVFDHGGDTSLEPVEATSYGNVDEYTLYDNGVEGTMTVGGYIPMGFRIKTDGWFTVWIDRTRNFDQRQEIVTEAKFHSPLSVLRWYQQNQNCDIVNNRLAEEIQGLFSNLSNSANFTFNYADVGLYGYHIPDATTVTSLSHAEERSSSQGGVTRNLGFSYASGTTVDELLYGGFGESGSYEDQTIRVTVTENGVDLCHYTKPYQENHQGEKGSLDALANGLAQNPETQYDIEVYSQVRTNENEHHVTVLGAFH